jgi:glutaredoxin
VTRCFAPVLLGALLLANLADAGVYKWKDADGNWQFSDQAPEGVAVEQVKIRSFQAPPEVSDAEQPVETGKVVMLSASWCGVCTRARAYMTQKGIPFTEHDVETSTTGRDQYRQLAGRGVPIILVGSQRMDGFSAARLDQLLQK